MIRQLRRTNRLRTTLNIIGCVFEWILIVIVIYSALRLGVTFANNKLKYEEYYYRPYSIESIPQVVVDKLDAISEPEIEYSKKELKVLVEDNIHFTSYLYIEVTNLWDIHAGLTSIPTHTVMVLKNLNNMEYVETLTHEIIHLKYCTSNETFTNFMTFKYLYESDNQYLKFASREMAMNILYDDYSSAKQYDCGYYIIKYLEDN